MDEELELVEKYISFCSLMCKDASDYSTPKVKIHNNAMAEWKRLVDELGKDIPLAIEVYERLLCCEDGFVRQTAATDCLALKIHTKQAVKILKQIVRNGDAMASMTAKRTLLVWRGKLGPDEPF